MCLIVILNRVVDEYPVVVAANREESYDRPGTPPQLWHDSPAFVAGRDLQAGGTWLGVNQSGVLVAVTNRPGVTPSQPRSRGLLCRDLLASRSAEVAHGAALDELNRHPYASCNVLAMDRKQTWVVHFAETPTARRLDPGIHVLGRGDVDEPADLRTSGALRWFAEHSSIPAGGDEQLAIEPWLHLLRSLCAGHGDERSPPICVHANDRGTVSSSIIALSNDGVDGVWLHAQGPPCRTEYADCSALLRQLESQ